MTNKTRVTYSPFIAEGNPYIQIWAKARSNPYLDTEFNQFEDQYNEEKLLIDAGTGEIVKPADDGVSVIDVDALGHENSGTILQYAPGGFTVESPDELFWYFGSSKADRALSEGLADFRGKVGVYNNEVTLAGPDSDSNTHTITMDNDGNPIVDGDGYNALLLKNGLLKFSIVEDEEEPPLPEESEEESSLPEPETEEEDAPSPESEGDTEEQPEEEDPLPPEEETESEESDTIPSEPPADEEEAAEETDNSGENMAKYDELAAAKGKLIRKALGGFIMVAPMDVEVPEKIFADKEGNFIDFKEAGFTPLGWLTKGDGINFSRETEQAEVESFGAQEPTRVDFTKDATSAAFNCQETNRKVLELYYAQDLSEVKPDAETGEISFEQRDPETIYRRMIYIAHDGKGKDAKYIVKIMPKATISEVQEQSWSSESELAYGMTAKASKDDDLGYSVRHVFGGPGFEKLYADMGFTNAGGEDTASE